mmetsp:Transcript_9800/g.35914  ORF Transcript_9800/g.35914 Transcript_9800/m.35914 type:complete len:214 (+) Transcript_9800:534-1175(+)
MSGLWNSLIACFVRYAICYGKNPWNRSVHREPVGFDLRSDNSVVVHVVSCCRAGVLILCALLYQIVPSTRRPNDGNHRWFCIELWEEAVAPIEIELDAVVVYRNPKGSEGTVRSIFTESISNPRFGCTVPVTVWLQCAAGAPGRLSRRTLDGYRDGGQPATPWRGTGDWVEVIINGRWVTIKSIEEELGAVEINGLSIELKVWIRRSIVADTV